MPSTFKPRRSQRTKKPTLRRQEIDAAESHVSSPSHDRTPILLSGLAPRATTRINNARTSIRKKAPTTAAGASLKRPARRALHNPASVVPFPNLPEKHATSSVASSPVSGELSLHGSTNSNALTDMAAAPKGRGRPKAAGAAVTNGTRKIIATTTNLPIERGRKRKNEEDDGDDERAALPLTKKPRAPKVPKVQEKVVINHAPTQRLDLFVCGEGSNGELGLGTAKNVIDVKRPRLNAMLSAKDVGVVQVACGGMHALALTHDGKVLSWGVNDGAALGRSTGKGPLKDLDMEEDDISEPEDSGLNPDEANPAAVAFPEGIVIVKLAAGDGISLALTDDGHVYGWGEFRGLQGEFGFWRDMTAGHTTEEEDIFNDNGEKIGVKTHFELAGVIKRQTTPRLYTELSNIVDIACGNNHCLARDQKGMVFTWGIGEQHQLGRRQIERIDTDLKRSLVPQPLRTGKTKFTSIFCGADHSFATDGKGQVHAWGFNGYGQLAVRGQQYFQASKEWQDVPAEIVGPIVIKALTDPNNPIVQLAGGQKHSVALRQDGTLLSWGLIEFTGIELSNIPPSALLYNQEPGRGDIASAVIDPQIVPALGKVKHVGCGSEHTIAINANGKAFSWGSGSVYQLGLGKEEDEPMPTLIDNTAVREKKLSWAAGGGQYSMLTAPAVLENGA